jgi:methionyl-tRNA synthetase
MALSPAVDRVLVCVAWPYAQSATHVGQIAGSVLPGDIFARYHRLAGHDVLMISGSDEHGTPITVDADREGISPRELVARHHAEILDVWRRLGIAFDHYTETTSPSHARIVQSFFLRLFDQGLLFKGMIELPYCPTDARFLPDRYVAGTCPYCEYGDARGDQCSQCGRTLDPTQLLDPRCMICGSRARAIEIRETEHFFLDLPKLEPRLLEWLLAKKESWRPAVTHFALNWITEGLRPRAITRDMDWGVPVPKAGFERKRIYVWFDAVIGYLSASVEWAERIGQPDAWRRFWELGPEGRAPARAYYFIGKDNIPFHAIIWPAMLLGYGGLALPYDIPANEFIKMNSDKASTLRGKVVWTRDALDRYGADPLRYYLASILPETRDTTFSYADLARRNNDELVATYGNAAHRVLTFLQRHFDRRVPQPGLLGTADQVLLAEIERRLTASAMALETVRLRDGLAEAMGLARDANRYLEDRAPWKRVQSDPGSAATSLYVMTQVLNGLKILFAPYVPFSSQRLHELLGFSGDVMAVGWTAQSVPPGQALPTPEPLFAKLDFPS